VGSPTRVYEAPTDEFVAKFIGHINFFPGEVVGLSGDGIDLKTSQGNLRVKKPAFPVSVGDRVKLVVRPESIDLVDARDELAGIENVIKGRVEVAMYIGSIIRYTIIARDQTIYVDNSDPQYRGIFQEGSQVKLILKKQIHILKA